MADATPPPPSSPPPNPDEIPLEDIDRLLEAEDPGFTQSLEEVRNVKTEGDVTIEASAIDESLSGGDEVEEKVVSSESRIGKLKARIKIWRQNLQARIKARLILFVAQSIVFLKTRPKEFLFFSIAFAKVAAKKSTVPLHIYQEASRFQKITGFVLTACVVGAVWVLFANFKGIWIPQITQPVLRSFEPYADHVETFDPKDKGESFYSAFPQERHEFLFPKMKVNLRRTKENPLPMGAFEVIVLVDSKDSAIEIRDREVEFFDLLQRVFEEETFTDLESEMGKARLKSRVKRELNQKLTQGWIKDISFKTFILKP